MKCRACDTLLSDKELMATDSRGEHYDLCRECLNISLLVEHDAYVEPTDYNEGITYSDTEEMLEYLCINTIAL